MFNSCRECTFSGDPNIYRSKYHVVIKKRTHEPRELLWRPVSACWWPNVKRWSGEISENLQYQLKIPKHVHDALWLISLGAVNSPKTLKTSPFYNYMKALFVSKSFMPFGHSAIHMQSQHNVLHQLLYWYSSVSHGHSLLYNKFAHTYYGSINSFMHTCTVFLW